MTLIIPQDPAPAWPAASATAVYTDANGAIYVVYAGDPLDPALTASWEKGLTMVANGTISSEDYMKKLDDFVTRRTKIVKEQDNKKFLYQQFLEIQQYYKK